MGRVYQADHSILDCQVAIKVLHSEFCDNETILQRFIDEARMLAILKSPHTVRVIDAEVSGSHAFLVMEYVDGTHLGKYLDRYGNYDVPTLLNLGRQVALALAEAHEHGIVHRDIKPENILLTRDDEGDLMAKVADFGIAKRTQIDQTRTTLTGAVLGTPCYMAPEQYFTPGQVDQRADIFALGVLIYEMCSGKLPFIGDDINQIMLSVTNSAVVPLHEINAAVPIEVSRLVSACLSYDRNIRLGSAQVVADRLQTIIEAIHPLSNRRPRLATANTEIGDSRAPAVITIAHGEKSKSHHGWTSGLMAALAIAGVVLTAQANPQLSEKAETWRIQGAQELNLALTPDTIEAPALSLAPRSIQAYQPSLSSEVVAPADVELLDLDESLVYGGHHELRSTDQLRSTTDASQPTDAVQRSSARAPSHEDLSTGALTTGIKSALGEPQVALAVLDPMAP